MKKILLLIAHKGYQPIEYGVTKEVLLDNGFSVITASNKSGIATATDSSTTTPDLTLDKIVPTQYGGVFLIGGSGALENLNNQITYSLLQQFKSLGKLYGAICVSPRILAYAEVLGGKKATGWNGDNELDKIFAAHDITYIRQPVIIDGNAITADGPTSAQAFGEAIVNKLK